MVVSTGTTPVTPLTPGGSTPYAASDAQSAGAAAAAAAAAVAAAMGGQPTPPPGTTPTAAVAPITSQALVAYVLEACNLPQQFGSRSVDCFERDRQVGEGTYGQVYLALDKVTREKVALKKIRMDNEKEGFPITAIREIKILMEMDHPNVVKLKEIVASKSSSEHSSKNKAPAIYLVFFFADHDLSGLMERFGSRFSIAQIKCYVKQLLEGLYFCHRNKVLHRDLKASNLLVTNQGQLMLADFGLARPLKEKAGVHYTNRVITLWYRPPELLLGESMYGTAVDIWSAGCILAEMLLKKPILPGRNELEQLELIFKLCGSPDDVSWPEFKTMPFYQLMKPAHTYPNRFAERFAGFPDKALDLVSKMLELDPAKRISAQAALDHDFFWTDPYPADPHSLPKYPPSHEWEAKQKRRAASAASNSAAVSGPNPNSSSNSSSSSLPSIHTGGAGGGGGGGTMDVKRQRL